MKTRTRQAAATRKAPTLKQRIEAKELEWSRAELAAQRGTGNRERADQLSAELSALWAEVPAMAAYGSTEPTIAVA